MDSFQHLIKPSSTAFFILSKSGKQFYLFDSKNLSIIRKFDQSTQPIQRICISQSHNTMICLPHNKSLLSLYQINSGTAYLKSSTIEKFNACETINDGSFVIFGSQLGNVFIYNTVSGQLVLTFTVSKKNIRTIEVSEDSELVLFACDDNRVYVYHLQQIIKYILAKFNSKQNEQSTRTANTGNVQRFDDDFSQLVAQLLKSEVQNQKSKKIKEEDLEEIVTSLKTDQKVELTDRPNDFLYGMSDIYKL